jgi:hypothetical protein
MSDDEDAITPCPPQKKSFSPQNDRGSEPRPQHGQQHHPRPNAQRQDSWRSSLLIDETSAETAETKSTEVDSVTLWRRMLVIQRLFGCYNSARMSAALEMGDDGARVVRMSTPDTAFRTMVYAILLLTYDCLASRTCLDLLNDSIDQLPEESRRQLEAFLEHGEDGGLAKRKSWRQRLQEMRQAR